MPKDNIGLLKFIGVAVCACALAACGGGGGGGGSGSTGRVTISGRVTYDFVPVSGGRLDYDQTVALPVRLATVQFMTNNGSLATSKTDTNGNYSLSVPANRSGFVRVSAIAELTGTPGWRVRVVDNTSNDAIYVLDGGNSSSGSGNSTRNLRARSGWDTAGNTGYTGVRAAAPFAILDTIYVGTEYALTDTTFNLPTLNIHWSPENTLDLPEDGLPDPDSGEIGGSFFAFDTIAGLEGMYLVGEEDWDTDEYDRHVILHEYGHFLDFNLARSDNIGGPHGPGDKLDMRLAFSEGWPTAFAALALGDPVYTDTGGDKQQFSFSVNVESDGNSAPGWYSEVSMWQLFYDLADDVSDGNDVISYPFADLVDTMTGPVVETRAQVSIFPFWNAIKDAHPGDEFMLDALTLDQSIAAVQDDFGTDETNDANSPDVLPIYMDIDVNAVDPVNLCSTDEFTHGLSGGYNKLGIRRFLRFTPTAAGQVTITVTATDIPDGQYSDPDWIVYDGDDGYISDDAPNETCQMMMDPSTCAEPDPDLLPRVFDVEDNREYVLEVYEWQNTLDPVLFPDLGETIGRTCFNVTVKQ